MDEHARIARYFAPLAQAEKGSLSLTDDAALLNVPAGKQLVVTTDSVIGGVHLPTSATGEQFAAKLMRRNLSDLAAIGASPWRYFVNLHMPKTSREKWLADFAATLAAEQQHFGLTLAGGDSTSGKSPIHATMTVLGLIGGKPLLRSTAKAGDILFVSGTIGDAALGLKLKQKTLAAGKEAGNALLTRYYRPEPRLRLGQALENIATAAIDISDGLLADVGKLAAASHLGAMVMRDAVPLSSEAATLLQAHPALWETILTGGDDYELAFTVPWAAAPRVEKLAQSLGLPLTRIGSVGEFSGLRLVDGAGNALAVTHGGYEH